MVAFLGIAFGLVVGLTPVAGTAVGVPLLVYALGLDVHSATSVSLAAVVLVAAVAAGDAARMRLLSIPVALPIVLGCVIGAPFGVVVAEAAEASALLAMHGTVTVLAALTLAYVTSIGGSTVAVRAGLWRGRPIAVAAPAIGRRGPLVLLERTLSGLVAGLIAGMLGVGGAFLVVPLLLREPDFPLRVAVAISLLVLTMSGISGVVAAFAVGRAVPWYATGLFLLGAVAGIGLARRISDAAAKPAAQRGGALVLAGFGMAVFVASFVAP